MDIRVGDFKFTIDDSSGIMNLEKNGKTFLTGLEFFLNYDGENLDAQKCDFEGVTQEENVDGEGDYKLIRLDYTYKKNSISLFVKIYTKIPAFDIHLENDFNEPKFGEISGGIKAKELEFNSATCFNNEPRGPEFWLKTVKSHFSMPWLVLKPTFKHLFKAVPISILKGLNMFELSRRGMDWDSFAYPDFIQSDEDIPDHTHFFFTQKDGLYISAVASCGSGQKGKIKKENENFLISSIGCDKTGVYNKIPCGSFGVSENPYEAAEAAYQPINEEKDTQNYFEIFEYLGCCTWNSLYEKVSDESLRSLVDYLTSKDIPIKFAIIDDGWQRIDDSKQLLSFEPNEEFSDMKSTIDALKSMGVEYVGVWHALQGDWEGINPEADLPKDTLFYSSNGKIIPSPKGTDFYNKWYGLLSQYGIDFVKVDNQYDIVRHTLDKIPIYEASTNLLNSVYDAAEENLETVLNCMSMIPECIYNDVTNISRNSIDYIPYSKENAKYHIQFNIYNSLWVSNLTHPDYDMFQTHDPYAIPHAVSRVLSGGPVYLTDMIGETNVEVAKKLSFKDGKIPMPDKPALPTEDCLLKNPYENKVPLKAYTQVGDIGLVEAFNIYKGSSSETVTVRPDDARLSDGNYIVYGYFSKKYSMNELSVSLGELDCELFIISPIFDDFAVIGLLDIYNPPRGVIDVEVSEEKIKISVYQTGTYAFFCDFEPEKIEGAKKWDIEDSILKIEAEEEKITIHKP